jgi:hypothetical protein
MMNVIYSDYLLRRKKIFLAKGLIIRNDILLTSSYGFYIFLFYLNIVASGNRLNKKKTEHQGFEMRSNQKTEVIRSRHLHITLMLLAVAVVFLLLTLPNSIYFVLDLTYGFNKEPTVNDYYQWLRYRRLTILTVIMFQLSDLQHATNFFLYLLTSDKFRRSVLMICASIVHTLLKCCCQQKTDSSSSFQPRYSSQRQDKTTMLFLSSGSDVLTTTANPRSTSTRQAQPVAHNYRSLVSNQPATIIEPT